MNSPVGSSGPVGPVFITGLSHSGKTPLRLALESSGEIAITRKTYLWPKYSGRFGDLADPDNLRRCLDMIMSDPGVRRLNPDRDCIEAGFAEGSPTYSRLFASIHADHASRAGMPRWGDQLGSAERFADTILGELGEAVFLHLVRDPRERAAFVSHAPGLLGWETRKWIDSARRASSNTTRHPGRYHVIAYEAMAREPAETLQMICDRVDVCFSDRMLTALRAGLSSKSHAAPIGARDGAYVARRAGREMSLLGYSESARQDKTRPMPIEWVGAAMRVAAERIAPRRVAED